MMETTVVHFSGMQVMLMIALCAIAVLVPVWAIRRIARAVPPVYQVPGIPSGVGGLLLFTIVLLIVEAVNALYHFGRAAGEAARVISMSTDYLWPVAQTLIPDFAASFFLLIAIGALVFGRSSVALRKKATASSTPSPWAPPSSAPGSAARSSPSCARSTSAFRSSLLASPRGSSSSRWS